MDRFLGGVGNSGSKRLKVISNNESTKRIVHEKHERHERILLLFVIFVSFVDFIFFYGSDSSWDAFSQESPNCRVQSSVDDKAQYC